ncbi:MAG: hypothetical protein KatS3mg009_1159 [Acidimicrobiia bacterium]|nr:MAG: hypothetical protein KatS3mg009_1159 [Acidimicrobiia bacterium]
MRAALATACRYELRALGSQSRLAWLAGFCGFAFLISLLSRAPIATLERPAQGHLLATFVVAVVAVPALALALAAAPALAAELEAGTWWYVTARPRGAVLVLAAKYVAAVVWATAAGLCALAVMVVVYPLDDRGALVGALAPLVPLAVLAYAGLFLLLGVLNPRRAMLLAVTWMLLVEGLVGILPSVAPRFTVLRHVANVGLARVDLASRPELPEQFVGGTVAGHVLVLTVYAVATLVAALVLVARRQFAPGRVD